jgi:hypothetical protein
VQGSASGGLLLCGVGWLAAMFIGAFAFRRDRDFLRRWSGLLCLVGFLTPSMGLKIYVRQWESRRAEMYLQEAVTKEVLGKLGRSLGEEPPVMLRETSRTAEWSDVLPFGSPGRGLDPTSPRVRVSGGNGSFSLRPIRIELFDASLTGPWLDELLLAYRQRAWRFQVVGRANASLSAS